MPHQYDEGFFLVRVENAHDCLAVLDSGPYTIKKQPVVLKQWTADFKFSPEQMTVLPLGKVATVTLQFWGQKSLSRIASVAGKPLHTDECNKKQSKIGFARVLVEVDVSQPLMTSTKLKTSSNVIIEQKLEFEWVPVFFQRCQLVGHECIELLRFLHRDDLDSGL